MMGTRPPHWLNAIARFTATVVLPTPPLPAPTAMMFLTPGTGALLRSPVTAARTCAVISMSTAATPERAATTARACSFILSFMGQAGVVSSMANEMRPPSIRRFLMNLRLTMSRLRSGSRTAFSASSTAASETIRTLYRRAVRERPLQDPLFGHVAGDRELELLALICLEHEDEPQNGGERDDEEDRDEHPEDGD